MQVFKEQQLILMASLSVTNVLSKPDKHSTPFDVKGEMHQDQKTKQCHIRAKVLRAEKGGAEWRSHIKCVHPGDWRLHPIFKLSISSICAKTSLTITTVFRQNVAFRNKKLKGGFSESTMDVNRPAGLSASGGSTKGQSTFLDVP